MSGPVLGMLWIPDGAGGCADSHINKPKRRVRARELFSSRRKGNIPNIWLHIGSLSSLHSLLQKLIRQGEGRGKSQTEWWRPKIFIYFFGGGVIIHDPHFHMFLKSALMYLKGLVQAPRHQKTETCMKSKGLLTAQRSDVQDDLLCLQSDTHFFVYFVLSYSWFSTCFKWPPTNRLLVCVWEACPAFS